MEWINVLNKLPDEHVNVLVHLDTGIILIGIIDSDYSWGIYYSDGRNIEDPDRPVTHWMPLPLAPSQKE